MKKIDYNKKILITNSFFSVISRIIGMIMAMISAPLLLHLLGNEKYGIWVTLLSIVSWIYTFDFGIANGLRNKLTECLATNKESEARKYLGTAYFLLGLASFTIFFLIAIIIYFCDITLILNMHIDNESLETVLLVAVFFACVNFTISLVRQVFYALQRSALDSIANTSAQIAFTFVLYVLSKCQLSFLIIVAVAEGVMQMAKNIISSLYVFYQNHELFFSLTDIDKKYAGGILSFGLQMFIVQIAALILNTTDNLIISHYLGAKEVTPYSICYKYFGMIESVYVAVFTPFMGAYTAAYARRDIAYINRLVRRNIFGYIIFALGIIFAGYIFKPFAYLWLGQDLGYAQWLIPLTALYFAMLMFTHVFSCVLAAFSMIREVTFAVVLEAIVNIPISVYCAVNLEMGTVGVIVGSLASMIIAVIVFPTKAILVLWRINKEYN